MSDTAYWLRELSAMRDRAKPDRRLLEPVSRCPCCNQPTRDKTEDELAADMKEYIRQQWEGRPSIIGKLEVDPTND